MLISMISLDFINIY